MTRELELQTTECLPSGQVFPKGGVGLRQQGYSLSEFIDALRETGLRSGDIVFFQVSHESLGSLEKAFSEEQQSQMLYAAIREVMGPDGTMCVPAFSHSFETNQEFDRDSTPCVEGKGGSSVGFLEYCRRIPEAVRSIDPNFSVVALGPKANELLRDLPFTSFGKDSFFDRLTQYGGKICGIGASLADTPFLHLVEEEMSVPFRYKKLFTGHIWEEGLKRKQGWITSVPIQASDGATGGTRLEETAREDKLFRVAKLGKGEVYTIECLKLYELAKLEIQRDPRVTKAGLAVKQVEVDDSTTTLTRISRVQLLPDASIEELISKLWRLPRDIISDGYDVALKALGTQVPITVHEYPTGTECWTWVVPEKWTCEEAWLETIDGRRLISYADNPLHVVSYSLPFDREVSRQELLEHLHVHPVLPDAIPFVFKYYERDWGLCCSRKLKDSLRDDRYRVVIRSSFSFGTLKVGEVIVPGESERTFVLCAHLCHPAMVNDDLSGVIVGIKVMQELLRRRNLKYTYRLLILPETIGSVAYLSHHEDLIPKMVGGLFLEMLALENPHALQLSFAGDTRVDGSLTRVLKETDPNGWIGAFRTVVGNDERQFNAPGVRVPMLSLSRVKKADGGWPYYPEYHSSFDSPERASFVRLAESKKLVLKMIEAVEDDVIPLNKFKGEIFCSRFGLHIDAYENSEGNRALFDIIFLIDGTKSLADIAKLCGISVRAVSEVVDRLQRLGLVEYSGIC
jgi:aminopeptidase-like protein/aminoglycoside N3'-acetyltransferase